MTRPWTASYCRHHSTQVGMIRDYRRVSDIIGLERGTSDLDHLQHRIRSVGRRGGRTVTDESLYGRGLCLRMGMEVVVIIDMRSSSACQRVFPEGQKSRIGYQRVGGVIPHSHLQVQLPCHVEKFLKLHLVKVTITAQPFLYRLSARNHRTPSALAKALRWSITTMARLRPTCVFRMVTAPGMSVVEASVAHELDGTYY